MSLTQGMSMVESVRGTNVLGTAEGELASNVGAGQRDPLLRAKLEAMESELQAQSLRVSQGSSPGDNVHDVSNLPSAAVVSSQSGSRGTVGNGHPLADAGVSLCCKHCEHCSGDRKYHGRG